MGGRTIARLLLVLVLALGLGAAGCGGGGDEEVAAPPDTATAAPETEPDAETASPETDGGAGETTGGAVGCRDVEQPPARPEGTETIPTTLLDADRTYEVLVRTSCGDFTITLDPESAPEAAASFAALAESGFYDDTYFHRIVPGFVIQGGDPLGTGLGGPGYSTVDTPAQSTTYELGVVAMAKSAAEAPGTAGSQFFVVTAPDAGLPPEYAVIGKVTEGLDVVQRIGVLGDPNTEQPTQPVVIDDMEVQVS